MNELSINYVGALVAALASFLIGGLWYSVLFAKAWQRLSGVTDDQMKAGMARIFGGSFVLALAMAFNLAAFIGKDAGAGFGALAGFAAGFGWVAMAFGVNYLFERRPFGLFLINAGYNAVTFTVMGLIIGMF